MPVTRQTSPPAPSGRQNVGHSPTCSSSALRATTPPSLANFSSDALRATKRQSLANSLLWCPPGNKTPRSAPTRSGAPLSDRKENCRRPCTKSGAGGTTRRPPDRNQPGEPEAQGPRVSSKHATTSTTTARTPDHPHSGRTRQPAALPRHKRAHRAAQEPRSGHCRPSRHHGGGPTTPGPGNPGKHPEAARHNPAKKAGRAIPAKPRMRAKTAPQPPGVPTQGPERRKCAPRGRKRHLHAGPRPPQRAIGSTNGPERPRVPPATTLSPDSATAAQPSPAQTPRAQKELSADGTNQHARADHLHRRKPPPAHRPGPRQGFLDEIEIRIIGPITGTPLPGTPLPELHQEAQLRLRHGHLYHTRTRSIGGQPVGQNGFHYVPDANPASSIQVNNLPVRFEST